MPSSDNLHDTLIAELRYVLGIMKSEYPKKWEQMLKDGLVVVYETIAVPGMRRADELIARREECIQAIAAFMGCM